jgi:hypothetical protein
LIQNQPFKLQSSNFESLQSTKAILKSLEEIFLKNQELRESSKDPKDFMESEE